MIEINIPLRSGDKKCKINKTNKLYLNSKRKVKRNTMAQKKKKKKKLKNQPENIFSVFTEENSDSSWIYCTDKY